MIQQNKIELRNGWVVCSLGDILYLKNGFAFKSSDYSDRGVPVIRISDIQNGRVLLDSAKMIEPKEEFESFLIERGDILIAMSGATTGKFGLFFGSEKAYQNQRVGNFKLFSEDWVYKKFIFYLLEALKKAIEERAYGGAQPNISAEKIEGIQINLPPLAEQHRIVAKIEELFSDLDAGIASLKQAQAQLKTYRQAVLKYAFEGKLTAAWREQRQPEPAEKLLAQIKAEREKQYQQQLAEWQKAGVDNKGKKKPPKPQKPKEFPPLTEAELAGLPELPEGWCWAKLGGVAEGIQYGYTAPSSNAPIGPKMLRITDIQDYKVNWNDVPYCNIPSEQKPNYLLKDGDLVFARTGATVGKSFLIKGTIPESVFASYLIRIRLPKTVNEQFLYSFFQSIYYWQQITEGQVGIGQPNVNGTKLSELIFSLPSRAEQHQIVQEIESRLSVCDKLEESIKESLQKAEALRQSILKKAFEGKLVPQDPNDEPAEKLLERIKSIKS